METTAQEIADLVRAQNWKQGGVHVMDSAAAADLIQQYARAYASGEVVKAVKEHGESMLATLDKAINTPLARVSP